MALTALVAAVWLALGLPCLLRPQAVQRLLIHFYRFDDDAPRPDFFASEPYREYLRLWGLFCTVVGMFLIAVLTVPGLATFQSK